MASVYNSILDAVVTSIQSLSLVSSSSVVKRKLPKALEDVDTLPIICVVPSERPERMTLIGVDSYRVDYTAEVVIIRANNADQLDGLATALEWREQIRQLFDGISLSGVSEVFCLEPEPSRVLDRGLIAENYDCSALHLVISAHEAR